MKYDDTNTSQLDMSFDARPDIGATSHHIDILLLELEAFVLASVTPQLSRGSRKDDCKIGSKASINDTKA